MYAFMCDRTRTRVSFSAYVHHVPALVYIHVLHSNCRDDTTANDAGAIILLYMQKQVDAPVISWRKITSGLGGFNIRLQV